MKSNCLIVAVVIRLRLGGEIKWTGPKRDYWPGHFYVILRGRKLDYHAIGDISPIQTIMFHGRIRKTSA